MLWGHITLRRQVSTWTSRRLSQRIWAAGNAGNMGSVLRSQLLDSRPSQSCPFSHFPFLCRKLIFQELLKVSWALEAFSGRSRAAASHRFIKTPLHIHKASSSGSWQS